MSYEFYPSTLQSLLQAISMAPMDLDTKDEETITFKLGDNNCDFLQLDDINYLIAISKERVRLDLEDINWERIIKNTYEGREFPSYPKFGT